MKQPKVVETNEPVKIINPVEGFNLERDSTLKRLSELKAELAASEADIHKAQAAFDAALATMENSETQLSAYQKALLRRDGLSRVIADIEGRIIPAFRDKERAATEQSRLLAYELIQPIHEKATERVNRLLNELNEVIRDYDRQRADVSRQAGFPMTASDASELGAFGFSGSFDLPELIRRLDVDANPLLAERYVPGPNYQPHIGLNSSLMPYAQSSRI